MASIAGQASSAVRCIRLGTAVFRSSASPGKCGRYEAVQAHGRCQCRGVPRKSDSTYEYAIRPKLKSQDKGYEPGALLNFLALMGWDHHAARPMELQATRNDNNSLSELFSMDELIANFDLRHVNHRKAAVDIPKLDFLNKMTLRRDAGRLGDDGNMRDGVEGHDETRRGMIARLQVMLRGTKVLAGRCVWSFFSFVVKHHR